MKSLLILCTAGLASMGAVSNEANRDSKTDETTGSMEPLWLVLIGHGTFDGHTAKFNLRGPDVSATDLAEWLAEMKRPLAVINCASSSSPFINRLAGVDH